MLNGYLLAMAEADGTTKPEHIPLLSQAFWVQVRSLPLAYMTRMMGNIIGNALGGYVVTDQSKTLERLGSYLRKVAHYMFLLQDHWSY